ncbi:MAG: hypothetical protein LPK80_05000 [Bacteroidota bacterium]|nr:hypothetical protein [Bacteroidota bacterium]MDX5427945.1 hypothetical protein [Bacteroidota bacterium]MDX5505793.1 hypothetical protein [Bacteroidota bacterium]
MRPSSFNKYLLLLLVLTAFAGCKKESLLDEKPSIEWVAYGPKDIQEKQDSVWFRIRYSDGDGDLGENDPKAHNLILLDTRINVGYSFRISELVPNNGSVPITGILGFSIPSTLVTGNDSVESVRYQVWVIDRAGNKSDPLFTEGQKVHR